MAIRDLFWACPLCATTGSLRANNRARRATYVAWGRNRGPRATHVAWGGNRRGDRCDACGAEFRRDVGATIVASITSGGVTTMSPAQWLERLPPRDPANLPCEIGPEPVVVRAAVHKQPVRQGRELIGWLDRFGPRRHGNLWLTADRLWFDAPDGATEWPLDRITAVQPTSSKLQIAARRMPVTAIRFPGGSVRLWDETIREAVRRTWRARGRGEITEFHPRITTHRLTAGDDGSREMGEGRRELPPTLAQFAPAPPISLLPTPSSPLPPFAVPRTAKPETFYRLAQWLPRTFWRSFSRLDVAGIENVPSTGPFLLISNHQSNLDPILIQAVCPRRVHAMAKSTQFAAPVIAPLMKRLHSFPVRRYQTDPQAVRIVLRRLTEGEGVAIYVEGERTWDGKLQPPRFGTIRLALKAGFPIVPTTITGSYDAWPRWDSRIQLLPIAITFGPPLHLPRLDRKADREAALPSAATTIMNALRRQLDGNKSDTARAPD